MMTCQPQLISPVITFHNSNKAKPTDKQLDPNQQRIWSPWLTQQSQVGILGPMLDHSFGTEASPEPQFGQLVLVEIKYTWTAEAAHRCL